MESNQKFKVKYETILLAFTVALLMIYEFYNQAMWQFWLRIFIELVVLLKAPAKDLHKYYFFFLPLSSAFSLYILDAMFFVVIFFKRSITEIKINKSFKWIFFIFFLELLHLPKFIVQDLSIESIISIMLFGMEIISMGMLFHDVDDSLQCMEIIQYSILGNLCMGVIFIIKKIEARGLLAVLAFRGGIGNVSADDNSLSSGFRYLMNSNLVSRKIGFTICAFIIYQMFHKKMKKSRMITVLTVILLVFVGFNSGSMSFVLIACIIIVCIVINYLKKLSINRIVLIAAIAVLGIALLNSIFEPAVQGVVRELSSGTDISNGRLNIWSETMKVMNEHFWMLLAGLGIQDYNETIILLQGNGTSSLIVHNIVLETLLGYGIVGIAFLSVWILEMIVECKGRIKEKGNLIAYMPVICFFIVMQTGNFWYGFYYNLPDLYLLMICVKCYFLKQEKNNEGNDYHLSYTI